MGKFRIRGIVEPGRINVKIDGRFTDIELHKASDEILAKLYADKCSYIELSPEEFLKQNPEAQRIEITPISIKKQKRSLGS